jgi:hypothetical protein
MAVAGRLPKRKSAATERGMPHDNIEIVGNMYAA